MDYKKPVNVLNIDDDNINNFILEKLVRKIAGNAKITMCLNGESAIEYLLNVIKKDEGYPDFIFVDVAMPIMNGWEFLNEYKHYELDKIIKAEIFIATSSVVKRDYDQAFSYDIVEDFITKPFSLDVLQLILNGRRRLA
jgi:CheY-like chemotaxis protein